MKKSIVSGSMIILASVILAACGSGVAERKDGTLIAIKVSGGALDGSAEFWNDAPRP